MIKTLCVIGMGLIGGSLACSLRKQHWCESIIGIDANQQSIDAALARKVIDKGYSNIEQCTQTPDVVVIAVPVMKVAGVLDQLAPWMAQCTAITDVSSTKKSIIADYQQRFGEQQASCFVPGHPIAGRECSGFDAALDDLFVQRKVILTPMTNTREQSTQLVTDMWQQAGACVEQMDADKHDKILAATSHLPHVLAYSLVHCLSTQSHTEEIFRYAAGGFADFTRIASSDPALWSDICMANRTQLLQALEHFDANLQHLRACLNASDDQAMLDIFTQAKVARDRYTNS